MTTEWKSIEKDGYPVQHGFYWINDGSMMGVRYMIGPLVMESVNSDRSFSFSAPETIKYYGPVDPPNMEIKEEPKYLTFTEALRVDLDGGTVSPLDINDFYSIHEIMKMCNVVFKNG